MCSNEFYNENCFKRHLDIDSFRTSASICSVRQKCRPHCRRIIYRGWKNHNCDVFRCRTCGADRGIEHKCFIQKISTDPGYTRAKQRRQPLQQRLFFTILKPRKMIPFTVLSLCFFTAFTMRSLIKSVPWVWSVNSVKWVSVVFAVVVCEKFLTW